MERRGSDLPFHVEIRDGWGDTAWLWRDVLVVGRAETPEATRERRARAVAAALRAYLQRP